MKKNRNRHKPAPMPEVTTSMLLNMREEAKRNLAEPGHEDVYIANYDYPAQVGSRELLALLDEYEKAVELLRQARKAALYAYQVAADVEDSTETLAHGNTYYRIVCFLKKKP